MSIPPKQYSFEQHMQNQNFNGSAQYKRFNEEYFAGSDIRIYFGDQWVDEITSLSFNLIENVQPIFGYASHTADAFARGSRTIQGQFSINFKESYYLHSITNRLESNLRTAQSSGTATNKGAGEYNNKVTVEQLLSKASLESEDIFEDYALSFEKSLWGDSNKSSMQGRTDSRKDESYFYPESGRPKLAQNGFNILILYGPYQQSYPTNVNLEQVATTAHSIIGVQLAGVGQVIDGSGNPVQETYNFVAKDIDWNINSIV